MSELKPVRIPARVVIVFSLWIAACAGGPSSSGGSGSYSPSTPTPSGEPATPEVPAPPVASRDTPPDRPWTAPERKFLDARTNKSAEAPTFPYGYYSALVQEWEKSGRLPKGTHNSPLLEKKLSDGATIYCEYIETHVDTDDGTNVTREITKIATGEAVVSYNPRFLADGMFYNRSVSSPGTKAWLHFNRVGCHGPAYVNHKPGPETSAEVEAVGAFTNGKKSGVWWECNTAGAVVAVGEYQGDARVGIWRYYSGTSGWLTAMQDETGGGNGLAEYYELKVLKENGRVTGGGPILVRSGQRKAGQLEGDVTLFEDGEKWYCFVAPCHEGKNAEGWWTCYSADTKRRVRDEWRNSDGKRDGPKIEYDDAGKITSRSEYKDGVLVEPKPEPPTPPATKAFPTAPADWQWELVSTADLPHPPAAIGCATAKSCGEKGWLLFGGSDGTKTYDETWIFVDNEWSKIEVAGGAHPTACSDASLEYLPSRSVWILFGGRDAAGKALGQTWEFDGKQWKDLNVSSPSARWGAAMAYQSSLDRLVLYGGTTRYSPEFEDTWVFKVSEGSWEQLPAKGKGPGPRAFAALAECGDNSSMLIYGGRGGFPLESADAKTWALTSGAWTQSKYVEGPRDSKPVLLGGGSDLPQFLVANYFDTVGMAFTLMTTSRGTGWGRMTENSLSYADGRAFCADGYYSRLLAYGGWSSHGCMFETWALTRHIDDGLGNPVEEPYVPGFLRMKNSRDPQFVAGHLLAFDEKRGRAVSYGGHLDSKMPAIRLEPAVESWEFDGTEWNYFNAHAGSFLVDDRHLYYDTKRQQVMLIQWDPELEAKPAEKRYSLYAWDGKTWSLVAALESGPREAKTVCFDRDRGVLVWVERPHKDVATQFLAHPGWWELHGTTWKQESWPDGPKGIKGSNVFFYDTAKKSLVVLEKNTEGPSVLHRWNGEAWSSEETSQSLNDVPAGSAAWVHDSKRGVTWFVGKCALWRLEGKDVTSFEKPERLSPHKHSDHSFPDLLRGWVDPESGQVFWQGGFVDQIAVNDLWWVEPDELTAITK